MTTVITTTTKPRVQNGDHLQNDDGLWQNHTNGSWMLRYSGQTQGNLDFKLEHAIRERDHQFKIYYRSGEGKPFIFLGNSTQNRIIRQRTVDIGSDSQPEERLLLEFIVTQENVVNEEVTLNDTIRELHYKYKASVLCHAKLPVTGTLTHGFFSYSWAEKYLMDMF